MRNKLCSCKLSAVAEEDNGDNGCWFGHCGQWSGLFDSRAMLCVMRFLWPAIRSMLPPLLLTLFQHIRVRLCTTMFLQHSVGYCSFVARASSAQVHAAVQDEVSAAIQSDGDVASMADNTSSQLREFVHDEVHDAVHDEVFAAIPSDTATPIADRLWAQRFLRPLRPMAPPPLMTLSQHA